MKNPNIETYRGRRPKCKFCEKTLVPNYDTVMRGDWMERYYDAEPDEGFPEHTNQHWETREQRWRVYWREEKVVSRKFNGTFGLNGNGFFCCMRCGYAWAKMKCRQEMKAAKEKKGL